MTRRQSRGAVRRTRSRPISARGRRVVAPRGRRRAAASRRRPARVAGARIPDRGRTRDGRAAADHRRAPMCHGPGVGNGRRGDQGDQSRTGARRQGRCRRGEGRPRWPHVSHPFTGGGQARSGCVMAPPRAGPTRSRPRRRGTPAQPQSRRTRRRPSSASRRCPPRAAIPTRG